MKGIANLSTFESIQNKHNQSIGYRGPCFSAVRNDELPDDPMFAGLFFGWNDDVNKAVEDKVEQEIQNIPDDQRDEQSIQAVKDRVTREVVQKMAETRLKEYEKIERDARSIKEELIKSKKEVRSDSGYPGYQQLTTYPDGRIATRARSADGQKIPYSVIKLLVDEEYNKLGIKESDFMWYQPMYTAQDTLDIVEKQNKQEWMDQERQISSINPDTDVLEYFRAGLEGKFNRVVQPVREYSSKSQKAIPIDAHDSLRKITITTAKELGMPDLADFFAHNGTFSQLTPSLYKQAQELIKSPALDRNIAAAYQESKVGKSIMKGVKTNYDILFPPSSGVNYDAALMYLEDVKDRTGVFSFPDHKEFRGLVKDPVFKRRFEEEFGKSVSVIDFDGGAVEENVVSSDVAEDYYYASIGRED